jgi:hypothetical protein
MCLARQIFLAWKERPGGIGAQADQMGAALVVAMARRRSRKESRKPNCTMGSLPHAGSPAV